MTGKFAEIENAPSMTAHYARLDGQGGFVIQEIADDAEGRRWRHLRRFCKRSRIVTVQFRQKSQNG